MDENEKNDEDCKNNILIDKKEDNEEELNESININNMKNKLVPDKIEKYDIYIPMVKDDDDIEEEDDYITIKKNPNYNKIMTNLKSDVFNFISKKNTFSEYPYFRVENIIKYIPKLSQESKILNEKKIIEIHSHIPYYHQYKNFKLLYSMDRDGTALTTMINKGETYENTILVVKNSNKEIFGAYLSEALKIKYNDFYGTAETFLFTFYDTNRIRVFPATRNNEHYIYTEATKIAFGCSDDNFSLSLEDDFSSCFTGTTTTYDNPPLCKQDTFIVVNCELWTISLD